MRSHGLTITLRCPRCDGGLLGEAGDAMLLCPACGEAREAPAGRALPLRFAAPPGTAARCGKAIPFYRWRSLAALRVRATAPEGEAGAARVSALEGAWVVAARIRRHHTQGDVGLEYTKR